ncbi:NUDIX domain-containing protein [Candidatus Kaiserbacteria bacterium]|nr:NUDIX domain-containing protein [Candidatus Kaiserbacteria bacterium]
MNYFQGGKEHPQHISVGAVMRNADSLIRVHHFPKDVTKGFWKSIGVTDLYILMRETLEPNETLEAALARGLAEEFNAVATLDDYLGAIISTPYDERTPGERFPFEKTTLYFLCTYEKDAGVRRDMSDAEGQSILEWQSADFLIPIMKTQRERFARDDVDESAILERLAAR